MCKLCFQGIVIAFDILKNANPFVFKCSCPSGNNRTESYAKWQHGNELRYDIPVYEKPLGPIEGPRRDSPEDKGPLIEELLIANDW